MLAIAAGGVVLVPRALGALRRLRLDIHVLMSLAVIGAVVLGQWDEAATVAFLFGLSEALEMMSLQRAQRAVRSLLEIAPETAERVLADGRVETVDARTIVVGDRVRVRAGERFPVDGSVLEGRSSADQRAITGESMPVPCGPGDSVYAGTVNGEGTVEVEATRKLGDSLISRIVERVRAAQAGRAPTERAIERFAVVYTPIVLGLALLFMFGPPLARMAAGSPPEWANWFYRGLVVLVISCPCALVIGTPVAVVSALTAAARRGVLIKGGQHLEEFGRLRILAFDKTGTLTLGDPDVVEVATTEGHTDSDILRIAAAIGDRGNHVVGRAIARYARDLSIELPEARDYRAVPGLGATCEVGSTRYQLGSHRFLDEAGCCRPDFHASMEGAESNVGTSVALSGSEGPLGWIRLADRPRPEAAGMISELKKLGIGSVMLTGDNARTAAAMARELGIDDQRAQLLPDDKVKAIVDLNDHRGPTGMVGDGVNDAPALAAARVSVALRGISSGAALETADIVLMSDDLSKLPWLVRLSRKTLGRIRQNIALAIGAKVLVMFLALFGLATLWMAIVADVGVSLLVVANALRLLRGTT
ncbi:MAG: cation-translocating P-type ATPase [Isosphaeraceae bacterium]